MSGLTLVLLLSGLGLVFFVSGCMTGAWIADWWLRSRRRGSR
jgi:hypothetical protein